MALEFPIELKFRHIWFLWLIFVEGRTPENPEETPGSKKESQQKTQPTYDTGSRSNIIGDKHEKSI